MWFFTSEGFYSAVLETRGKEKGKLVVRAREPGALDLLRERYMPALGETSITPKGKVADYRYRAWITHADFADGMANVARAIDYSNFKSEAARRRGYGPFEKALHSVWSVMSRLQPGGPYSQGGSSYPPIPKAEVGTARPKQRKRKVSASLPAAFPDTACQDCGHELEQEEGEYFFGRWVCKDIRGCSDRKHENSKKGRVRR